MVEESSRRAPLGSCRDPGVAVAVAVSVSVSVAETVAGAVARAVAILSRDLGRGQ